jgi:CxxC motif-containing protein (DUF1111 family)
MIRLSCVCAVLAGCGDNLADEVRQGGDTTVFDRTRLAFRQPATNLDETQRFRFQAGRSPFDFRWIPPKLGPLFNNDACLGCHGGNGRGLAVFGVGPEALSQALVRVSLTEGEPAEPGGPVPVPGLGLQLQDHATSGLPEARITLTWQPFEIAYGDGELVLLREPRLDVRLPDGSPLPANVRMSLRQPQPLIGLGLLEAIEEDTLRALEDPDDADGDGISGRVNIVWDRIHGRAAIGRFGWKANTPTLDLQVAAAFDGDLGLSSRVFPESVGMYDVHDGQLDDTTFFTSTIAVPAAEPRDAEARRGRALFDDYGCASCHVPTLVTGPHRFGVLGRQRIHAYTDLLLHDMGDLLTDARPDFLAEGTEWRTPPLWGIGLTQHVQPGTTFLHDGRARTLAEAILWHGGEGQAAREAFRTAPRLDREALLAFLRTL